MAYDNGSSTSLTRAIAILMALGSPDVNTGGGLGVVQIAHHIGREKSQVSRTLKTLAEAGLVLRDPATMCYRLGWRLFTLAASAVDQNLLNLSPMVLRQLVARVNEGAHLSVFEGGEVLTLMSENPGRSIQACGWVGRAAPLHCTSAGRALLFDYTDDEVRELIGGTALPPGRPNAPRDVQDLLDRLHHARQRGYVVVDEEFEAGLVAVAAPVRNFRGRVIAALNVSIPEFRVKGSLPMIAREVKAAADHLSQALAATPTLDETVRSSSAPHHHRRTL